MPNQKTKASLNDVKQKQIDEFTTDVYHTLLKPDRWFTGNPIKTWIKNNLFLPNLGLQLNSNLQTNRWSAYCHFDKIISFLNLVEKCNIPPGGKVLIHPFLDPSFVQIILENGFTPLLLDIEKDSLSFNFENFTKLLNQTNIDLVLLPYFNGLAKDSLEITKFCHAKQVPVIIEAKTKDLTPDFLKLVTGVGATGVIYKTGPSWFSSLINKVTSQNIDIADQEWFFSWFLEDRIVSSNETRLKESQIPFLKLLEGLHYLLLQKQTDWTARIKELFISRLVYKTKLSKNIDTVEKNLVENWIEIQKYALPDLVFEISSAKDSVTPSKKVEQLVLNWAKLQQNAKIIYNFLVTQAGIQPEGTLEIPVFYLDQVYTSYHFLTTEPQYWHNFFTQKGLNAESFSQIHPFFRQNAQVLPNLELICNFGLNVKLLPKDLYL